jgi:hypothetical protein
VSDPGALPSSYRTARKVVTDHWGTPCRRDGRATVSVAAPGPRRGAGVAAIKGRLASANRSAYGIATAGTLTQRGLRLRNVATSEIGQCTSG